MPRSQSPIKERMEELRQLRQTPAEVYEGSDRATFGDPGETEKKYPKIKTPDPHKPKMPWTTGKTAGPPKPKVKGAFRQLMEQFEKGD